jgi:hypothetical protein
MDGGQPTIYHKISIDPQQNEQFETKWQFWRWKLGNNSQLMAGSMLVWRMIKYSNRFTLW